MESDYILLGESVEQPHGSEVNERAHGDRHKQARHAGDDHEYGTRGSCAQCCSRNQ